MPFCALALAALAAASAPPPRPAATPARLSALVQRVRAQPAAASALPDLFRLYELREQLGDLAPLAAAFDELAGTPALRPDARALAAELGLAVDLSRGELRRAEERAFALAFVRSFALIGPFDNQGRAGEVTRFAPESDGYQPKKAAPGKGRDVAWRALPQLGRFGLVDLSSALTPSQEITVYAATVLHAAAPTRVRFWLGVSGAAEVWLNGVRIHRDGRLHPSRFDQQAFVGRLPAGDSALLIKLSHGTGAPGFSLRLTDAQDRPLAQLAAAARAPARAGEIPPAAADQAALPASAPSAQKAKDDQAAHDALTELQAFATSAPADARAQEELAIFLASRRPADEAEKAPLLAQRRAAEAAPHDAEVLLRLARYADGDANERRVALERALSAAPASPQALVASSRERLSAGDPWRALELAERAAAVTHFGLTESLALADAQDAVDLTARASGLRLALSERFPGDPRALQAAALANRRLGRPKEALAQLASALRLRFDDAELRGELVSIQLDLGDLDGALATLAEGERVDPDALYPKLRRAELLSQNGRGAEAEAAFAAALSLSPDSPRVLQELGRSQLRRGDAKGAASSFEHALALHPQDPPLRELLQTIKDKDRSADSYLADAAALLKGPPAADAGDVEVLADVEVVKVFPNGLSSRTHQEILRALSVRGAEQLRFRSLQYSPDRQVAQVLRARVIEPSGRVLEGRPEGERSVSEPWYGLYYDVRARAVSFPQVEVGDAVELLSQIDDAGSSNFFGDYFGDLHFLQGGTPRKLSRYVLIGPPGRTFYAQTAKLPGLVHDERRASDGGTILEWTAREVPGIAAEPLTPGPSEIYAWLHVSTYKDWDSVGRFYWGLVQSQLRVNDEIRSAAQEAVRGIPASDERARIAALYRFVVGRTRYVGLEFGINSFKPYAVDTVLSRRFGDCKDKASLLHALLEAVGIDSRLVLLRMRRLGAMQEAPASLAIFNHAILYVPKYELFLDGTAEFHGTSELPADDRGAQALIVEPQGGSRFVQVPAGQAGDNQEARELTVSLRPDGSAELSAHTRELGIGTPSVRRRFESKDERTHRAEEELSRSLPGARVLQVDVTDPHQLESPFETSLHAQANSFADRLPGGALRFAPFGHLASYAGHLAELSTRHLPLSLGPPAQTVLQSQVALPQGYRCVSPPVASGRFALGKFSLEMHCQGSSVRSALTLTLMSGKIAPADYGAFRSFLLQLDRAAARTITAVPQLPTAHNNNEDESGP